MIKTLLAQLKQYRSASILAPVFTVGEVLMEVLIPFVTASIIDKGIKAGNIQQVYYYGDIMLAMAFLSLAFGVLAGKYAANASSGFACNLRDGIYEKVQSFAFSNIDKYSTAGLVTRMTTDVTNLQNAYQMILRIAVRAPLMLICSMFMCFFISVKLSTIFLVAIVVLAAALGFIMVRTIKGCSPDNSACEGFFGRMKNEMFYECSRKPFWKMSSAKQTMSISKPVSNGMTSCSGIL